MVPAKRVVFYVLLVLENAVSVFGTQRSIRMFVVKYVQGGRKDHESSDSFESSQAVTALGVPTDGAVIVFVVSEGSSATATVAACAFLRPSFKPSPMGSPAVLFEVLGWELLCGDCASSLTRGGVDADDMSSRGGRAPVADGWAEVRIGGGPWSISLSICPICFA